MKRIDRRIIAKLQSKHNPMPVSILIWRLESGWHMETNEPNWNPRKIHILIPIVRTVIQIPPLYFLILWKSIDSSYCLLSS